METITQRVEVWATSSIAELPGRGGIAFWLMAVPGGEGWGPSSRRDQRE